MQSPLLAERFRGLEFVEHEDQIAFESVGMTLSDLNVIELEKENFSNLRYEDIRKQAAMLAFLIDSNTEVYYPEVTRPRFEVRIGYKEAVKRGALLYETEVFNLLFKFRGRIQADGVAFMCHSPNGVEWIMLCPDDTKRRISVETMKYRAAAYHLVFHGAMESTWQDHLLENLSQLVSGTRCANSLMHEYGHVLQHRIWAYEGILPNDLSSLYHWFLELGYAMNVADRIPKFMEQSDEDKVYLLKESFVEDYRINLSLKANKGIFELPNAFCFRGDFEAPELMYEGVTIVEKAINHKAARSKMTHKQMSYEPDRVALVDRMMADGVNYSPRRSAMSLDEHRAVVERLAAKKN